MNKTHCTLWLTGIPSSGEATVCELLKSKLHFIHLDSDDVREELIANPNFRCEERELIYKALIYFAKKFNDAGHVVITSSTSHLEKYRIMAKQKIQNIKEIYIQCSVEICSLRNGKGLYERAKNGLIDTLPIFSPGVNDDYIQENFPSYDIYEIPKNPDLVIDTSVLSAEQASDFLYSYILKHNS